MSTMKTRLRERLDPYLLPEVRDKVIADILEELEKPTPYMLDRGGDRMIGSVNEPISEAVLAMWQMMVRTAQEGG